MRAVLYLCELYPGICPTTEEEAQINLNQVRKNLSQVKKLNQLEKPQSGNDDDDDDYDYRHCHIP